MKPSLSSGMESAITTLGEKLEGPVNVRELVLKSESVKNKQAFNLASSPASPIFSTREKRGGLGSNVTCVM